MSTDSQNILSNFNALPEFEQREVAAEILRRASQWDNGPLTDKQLAQGADELFVELDQRGEGDLLPPDEWIAEFHRWTRSHTIHNPNLDVSRESIYDGRGE